jgi:hypothetical protein
MTPRCWTCGRYARVIDFWGNFAWAHGGLRKDGWQGWAQQVERFAMVAERAALAER